MKDQPLFFTINYILRKGEKNMNIKDYLTTYQMYLYLLGYINDHIDSETETASTILLELYKKTIKIKNEETYE